jgi:hypothetical protein
LNITIQAPIVHIYQTDETAILSKLSEVLERLDLMTPEMQQLVDNVHANTTLLGSAIALLQGLKGLVDQAAQSNPDNAVVKALADELAGADAQLQAAMVANTPAVPTGVPTA